MHTIPELTLTIIALNLDAPTAPPKEPTDPAEALIECHGYLDRCNTMLRQAQTYHERLEAQIWIDRAERQITYWQAARDRQGRKNRA